MALSGVAVALPFLQEHLGCLPGGPCLMTPGDPVSGEGAEGAKGKEGGKEGPVKTDLASSGVWSAGIEAVSGRDANPERLGPACSLVRSWFLIYSLDV